MSDRTFTAGYPIEVPRPSTDVYGPGPLLDPTAILQPARGAPIVGVGGVGFSLTDVVAVGGAPTLTMEVGPTGLPALRITTGVGVTAEIKFTSLLNSMVGGDAFLSLTGSYSAGNLDAVSVYVSQDAGGYAKGWVNQIQYGYAAPLNSAHEQGGPVTYWFRRANNTPFGSPTYPALAVDHKIRILPRSGTVASVLIHGFGFAPRRQKGRICVVWDDGYDSAFKLGVDSFTSRGIAQTIGIISSAVGAGGTYCNINQLRSFINGGGAVVAHGPTPSSGAGNLFSAYPGSPNPTQDAVSDMTATRKWLKENSLLVPGADKCYVWPQGTFQQAVNSTALLDEALKSGFTLGRAANGTIGSHPVCWDSLSRYNRLACPVIGHLWAGTTAAEATNIAAIVASIQALSTNRSDGFLMLHRVMPTTTNDAGMGGAGNITIRHADLETLAAAIATEVAAGTLETVTMAEAALTTPTLWNSV